MDDARTALERADTLAPGDAEVLRMMADLATRSGNFPLALKHLDAALAIEPDHILAQMKRAELLHKLNRYSEAIQYLDAIPKRHEHRAALLARRGTILLDLQRFEEARETFEALIKIEPKQYAAWNNLGNVYRSLGNLREAARCYAKAASLTKTDPTPRSNHLTALHYNPEVSAEEIYKVCQALGAMLASKRKPVRPAPIDRSPDKILRVGMFSDGFRQHPVGSMTVSALELLGSMGVEIYAYSTSNIVDGLTRRIMGAVKKWTPISHISHLESEKFAEIIRNDGIDILIDLAGHNAGSRMHTIALEPAPILVKWVGGLINTTGVEAFDYLITDSVESPPGSDHLYTEKLIRMPDDYICFAPPAHVPAVGPLPALKNGHITFGCFNNPTKINDVVLEQWAQLLHALPASRLFLKGAAYESTAFRNRIFDTLSKHGIGQDRIRMEGHSPHQELLARYNKVDIALDPWPYSGGLTTCEAMLMGVPVVTLPGPTFAGRHSATHLVNAGMPELVVQDWAQYRDRVLELASDLESLATIRSHLRRVLLESPVCNSERFARNLANALRAIWQRYCEGKPPAALTLGKDGTVWFEGDEQPVALQHPDPALPEHQQEFSFAFKGRIITVDHGGVLAGNKLFPGLNRLGVLTTIVIDPAGNIKDAERLKLTGNLQHHAHIALGDGKPVTLHACLDNALSGTLEPLPDERQSPLARQASAVLARVPMTSVRLDSIGGLDRVDWLLLDDAHDNLKILAGTGQLLTGLLLLQVRVRFISVFRDQPGLSAVSDLLAEHGMELLRLDNAKHGLHSRAEGLAIKHDGSQLLCADAIFVPNEARLKALDDNQKLKLAFLLHTAYDCPDLAHKLLGLVSEEGAASYLAARARQTAALPLSAPPVAGDQASAEAKHVAPPPSEAPTSATAARTANSALPTVASSNLCPLPHSSGRIRVVDIGANPIDGDPPYKKLLQEGKVEVVGFEPQQEALRNLMRRKGPYERYLPHAVGTGQSATLYLCRAPGMTSTLRPNFKLLNHFQGYPVWSEVLREERINTVRLDDVEEIDGIDWLKIDIQGGELAVFRNGENKLRDALVIQTEVNFIPLYENQPLFSEIDQWMRAHGFMLHTLLEERRRLYAPYVLKGQIHQGLNQLTTADAVYIRDINSLETLTPEQREKMATILHRAYGSVDLAQKIRAMSARGPVGPIISR